MTYKIGDKVIIKSREELIKIRDEEVSTNYPARTYYEMLRFGGRVTKIDNIVQNSSRGFTLYSLSCGVWTWDERHFNPYVKLERKSLKITKEKDLILIKDSEGDIVSLTTDELKQLFNFKEDRIQQENFSIERRGKLIYVSKDLNIISLYKKDIKEIKSKVK